ncbi:hypothetical protein [uncultured Gammaproteobacteria bacterium]|nr:hypothetical protein [uncultured Gammaproteobacteria bacterium]
MVRTLTWLALDDLTDSINACMPNANRGSCGRTPIRLFLCLRLLDHYSFI